MENWQLQWEQSELMVFRDLQPPPQSSVEASEVGNKGQDLTSQETTALPTLLSKAAWLKAICSVLKAQPDGLRNGDSQTAVQNSQV